jgi:hypothetical protein
MQLKISRAITREDYLTAVTRINLKISGIAVSRLLASSAPQHGAVAAKLTSSRAGSVMPVSKKFTLLGVQS